MQVTEARNLLIGGIVSREILTGLKHLMPPSHALYCQHAMDGTLLFLFARGNNVVYREDMEHVLFVLGHIAYPQKKVVAEEVLREIERYYRGHTHFPIDLLEGSFTLILLDKIKGIIKIYRNIVGFPAVYYSQTRDSTLFSDNLSVLAKINVEVLQERLKINSEQLASHFMYGEVWGQETLFSNILRIMPGEHILLGKNHYRRSQLQTFAHMTTSSLHNCVQSLEKAIENIMDEYVKTYPRLGNFFSGGVDSSYLQVHLARQLNRDIETFSADVVHPSWDIEREYAKSGSEFFKSHHTFVKVHPSVYPELLIEATAKLGHPLSDGQVALVPMLSNTAVENAPVCLCGIGADTLFGTGSCQQIDIAHLSAKLIPYSSFRPPISKIIGLIRAKSHHFSDALETLQKSFELEIEDEFSASYPLNFHMSHSITIGLMLDIFGSGKVGKAMSFRRGLLKHYQVTGNLKERLHALYLLDNVHLCEQFYQLASNTGLNLIFPYLDSRIIRTVFSMKAEHRFPFLQTKKVIKDALSMYVPKALVQRRKSGWGLPLFEWSNPGKVLFPLLKKISTHQFLKDKMGAAKRTSGWFIWNLLTFDLWHKMFIERKLK